MLQTSTYSKPRWRFSMNIYTCQICSIDFVPGPGCKGKYCSHTCSNVGVRLSLAARAGEKREQSRQKYMLPPKKCYRCDAAIPYDKRSNKFCGRSCSASTNNTGIRRHGNSAGVCERCGKSKKDSSRKFCSIICSIEARREVISETERRERQRSLNRSAQSKYRAKKYRVIDANANPTKIKEIYRNCPPGHEVDHIIPLSKGGKHHEDNLQYLTIAENRSKGSKLVGNVRFELTTLGL